jgi:hypothetical protein
MLTVRSIIQWNPICLQEEGQLNAHKNALVNYNHL